MIFGNVVHNVVHPDCSKLAGQCWCADWDIVGGFTFLYYMTLFRSCDVICSHDCLVLTVIVRIWFPFIEYIVNPFAISL